MISTSVLVEILLMIINNESGNNDLLYYIRNGRGCVRGKLKVQGSVVPIRKKLFFKN